MDRIAGGKMAKSVNIPYEARGHSALSFTEHRDL